MSAHKMCSAAPTFLSSPPQSHDREEAPLWLCTELCWLLMREMFSLYARGMVEEGKWWMLPCPRE